VPFKLIVGIPLPLEPDCDPYQAVLTESQHFHG